MYGHAPVVGPVPGSCAALRAADKASRLAAPLRPDGAGAAPRRAPHPRPGLRAGQLDHPAPRRHRRSRPRALDAPSCPPARAADAPALSRCERSTRPFRIARRRDFPQRAVFAARSAGGAAGDRARAAPRRARRAARAAGRPARAADRGDAGRAGAAGGSGEAMRILHLSDPHVQLPRWRERPLRDFGPLRALATVELWKGRGRDYDGALERLRQIVRDADALRADLVVCTGDLTQLAMEEEFALAQDALAPLGDRLTCIPGNHDRYPLAGHPHRLDEAYFPPRPLPERFTALDSCGEICWPVITQGRILASELKQDFRGKLVLVHHAPFRTGGVPDWPWHRLRGARKLLEAARDATAILCGHIHERFQSGNVICAGSSTRRAAEGYWVIELGPGRVAEAKQYLPGAREV